MSQKVLPAREACARDWRREAGGVYRPEASFQLSLPVLFQSKLVVFFKSALAKAQQDLLCALYMGRSKHSASLGEERSYAEAGQASKWGGEDFQVTVVGDTGPREGSSPATTGNWEECVSDEPQGWARASRCSTCLEPGTAVGGSMVQQ